jgi:hypothetical protein
VYEITGKIDEKAEQLYFGSFLTGTGRIVVDNFKLLIKEESGWAEVYTNSFETDQTGEFPQSFLHGNSDLKNQQSGYTFQVSSESAVDGKKSVIIEKKASPPETNRKELFAEKARIGEYIQEEIGGGLTCMLPIALYGKKDFTFPQSSQKSYTALQTSLSEISNRTSIGNNLYIHLADLVIAWNIFQHFYPYFDVAKTDWKANFT